MSDHISASWYRPDRMGRIPDEWGFVPRADGFRRWSGFADIVDYSGATKAAPEAWWDYAPVKPGLDSGWDIAGHPVERANPIPHYIAADPDGYLTLTDGRKMWIGQGQRFLLRHSLDDERAHTDREAYNRVRPRRATAPQEPCGRPPAGSGWAWDGRFWSQLPARYRAGTLIGAPRYVPVSRLSEIPKHLLYPYPEFYAQLRRRQEAMSAAPMSETGSGRPPRAPAAGETLAYVRVDRLNVRSGPGTQHDRIAILHHNAQITIDEFQAVSRWTWAHIASGIGAGGWAAYELMSPQPSPAASTLAGPRPIPALLYQATRGTALAGLERSLWAICLLESGGRTRSRNGGVLSQSFEWEHYQAAWLHAHPDQGAHEVPPPSWEERCRWSSWGVAQILGTGHRRLGFADPVALHDWLDEAELHEFEALVRFCLRKPGILQALQKEDLDTLTYLYNGARRSAVQWDERYLAALARIPADAATGPASAAVPETQPMSTVPTAPSPPQNSRTSAQTAQKASQAAGKKVVSGLGDGALRGGGFVLLAEALVRLFAPEQQGLIQPLLVLLGLIGSGALGAPPPVPAAMSADAASSAGSRERAEATVIPGPPVPDTALDIVPASLRPAWQVRACAQRDDAACPVLYFAWTAAEDVLVHGPDAHGWYQVRLPDGTAGWVYRDGIVLQEDDAETPTADR